MDKSGRHRVEFLDNRGPPGYIKVNGVVLPPWFYKGATVLHHGGDGEKMAEVRNIINIMDPETFEDDVEVIVEIGGNERQTTLKKLTQYDK